MSNNLPTIWRDSLQDVRGRVNDAFDRWLHRNEAGFSPLALTGFAESTFAGMLPAINVEETDDEVIVQAEMPGLDEKDFRAEVLDDRLVLRGEKRQHREKKKRRSYYAEASYGSFYRTIPLPCKVDADKSDATYRRGVLTVKLPKSADAKARAKRVKVK